MNELMHILDRFVIHFFASMSLVMLMFFALRVTSRKLKSFWLPDNWKQHLLFAAIVVFTFATLREPRDVANGQSVAKAVTDYVSWLAGCGVSAWGLYRFREETK